MAVEMIDLTVKFRNGTLAVNQVNLKIENGVFGLLGENGAGKITLMRVLTTILQPKMGSVFLNGTEYCRKNYEQIQKKIGYLPQELGLYPNLTVRETLEYLGGLSGIPKEKCKQRIDYYLEKTSLTEHQKKKNRQLSGGMKRRVGLIQALIHQPEVLIVDEPTTGLDPEERIRIRNLLVDFSKECTVLFSTHVVEDLMAVCSDLAVMKKGSILYKGKITDMLNKAKGHIWVCEVQGVEKVKELEEHYQISSKQYTERGILVKIISEEKPFSECQMVNTTLEDAYIYLNGNTFH